MWYFVNQKTMAASYSLLFILFYLFPVGRTKNSQTLRHGFSSAFIYTLAVLSGKQEFKAWTLFAPSLFPSQVIIQSATRRPSKQKLTAIRGYVGNVSLLLPPRSDHKSLHLMLSSGKEKTFTMKYWKNPVKYNKLTSLCTEGDQVCQHQLQCGCYAQVITVILSDTSIVRSRTRGARISNHLFP